MQIESKRFKKPGVILGILIGLLVLLFVWQYVRKEMAQQFAKSDIQVSTVEEGNVKAEVWHPQVNAIGSVKAVQGTNIGSVLDGKISQIYFKSGQMVKKGQILVQLDNLNLKAAIENARATYQLAQIHYQRVQKLYRSHSVSKETLDQARAQMQEDKATLDQAIALFNQSIIRAPFDGKIGLRQVSIGEMVPKGALIASVQQIDPVYVDFDLSEGFINQVRVGDSVELTTSTYLKKVFTGKITATNSTLNVNTRTLNIRAMVSNTEQLLIPGMFVNVNVIVPQNQDVLTVPEMAVSYSPFGDAVFKIVGNKAQQIYVKLGEQRGDRVAISGKVMANERIVTNGVFKLQNDSMIKVVSPPRVVSEKRPGQIVTQKIQRKPIVAQVLPGLHKVYNHQDSK